MIRPLRLIIGTLLALSLFLILPGTSLATSLATTHTQAETKSTAADDKNNPLQYNTIKDSLPRSRFEDTVDGQTTFFSPDMIINDILKLVNLVLASLAIIGLVISGIMYITAGDDPEKAKSARNNVIYIITGIVIYIAAYWLIVFGGDLIKKELGF